MADESVTPLDLSKVKFRRKSVIPEPYGTLEAGSYTMELLTVGEEALREVCAAAGLSGYPPYLEVARLKGDPKTIAAAPREQPGPATVPVNWVEDGKTARMDLSLLLAIHPFPVPRGTRAYVPLAQRVVAGMGPSLLLRFGKAQFKSIERKKRGSRAAYLEALAQVAAAANSPGK